MKIRPSSKYVHTINGRAMKIATEQNDINTISVILS